MAGKEGPSRADGADKKEASGDSKARSRMRTDLPWMQGRSKSEEPPFFIPSLGRPLTTQELLKLPEYRPKAKRKSAQERREEAGMKKKAAAAAAEKRKAAAEECRRNAKFRKGGSAV